jgi:hypothetical protein
MPDLDPESGEHRQRVDDQFTAVTGDVIALVGVRDELRRLQCRNLGSWEYR